MSHFSDPIIDRVNGHSHSHQWSQCHKPWTEPWTEGDTRAENEHMSYLSYDAIGRQVAMAPCMAWMYDGQTCPETRPPIVSVVLE